MSIHNKIKKFINKLYNNYNNLKKEINNNNCNF